MIGIAFIGKTFNIFLGVSYNPKFWSLSYKEEKRLAYTLYTFLCFNLKIATTKTIVKKIDDTIDKVDKFINKRNK